MKDFLLSRTIEGFMLSLGARHLSPNTIDDYSRTLTKFSKFLVTDPPIRDITSQHIELFLAAQHNLSNKSLLNHFIGLSAFWTWLTDQEIAGVHVVRKLTPPRAEQKEIMPLTEKEVKAIMGALERSRVYQVQGRSIDHSLGSADRNRAMILLMLDTGLRASELCDLQIDDLDNRNNRIHVQNGKGRKERWLPISARVGQMLWRYLAARMETRPDDPLFASKLNRSLTRTKLAELMANIGKRAGVPHVHPHRLRHTFAIQYLRNGGNVYTLQAMLGHNSMHTVKTYLRLSEMDMELVHRRASPVDQWRL